MFHIVWSNRTFINFRILTEYNFNFIHSIPHIFSTICIRPHVLEWIVKQGGWVSIGRAYIMVEQKDKMILSRNHPSDIRKEIEYILTKNGSRAQNLTFD